MLFYELFESIKFECNYKKLLDLINNTEKIIIKNKPKDEIDYERFGKYKIYVQEFVNIFKENFNEEQVNNMLKNLSTLEIESGKPLDKYTKLGLTSEGYYDSINNKITMITKNKKRFKMTLFHELLHMASNINKGDINCCGFDLDGVIGTGINEDYTEYLLEKYFNKTPEYSRRRGLVYELELIVGEKTLEELYFKADLPTLINKISKYGNRKEIIKIIYDYDSLYNLMYAANLVNKIENKMDRILKQKVKVKNNMI